MKKLFSDRPFARLLFVIARLFVLIYVGLLIVLVFSQRRMLYYPSVVAEERLIPLAAENGMIPWRNASGDLIGWQPAGAPPKDANIMLVFHGNAGFALHRTYLADGFQQPKEQPAFYVFLMEYPGYGSRPGSPSEKSLKSAASNAFAQLQQDYPSSRLFIVGESLGTGVAAWLAGENPDDVDGIFLITAFDRLANVAQSHYPILPVDLFLRDRFESSQALTRYHGPVGMLLAGDDTVIPPRFGKQLYQDCPGPKRLWIQEGRSHNELAYGVSEPWWDEVTTFLLQPSPGSGGAPDDAY